VASIAFGAAWTVAGLDTAILGCLIALAAAIAVATVVFTRMRGVPAHA
jgi:hypothetical protein